MFYVEKWLNLSGRKWLISIDRLHGLGGMNFTKQFNNESNRFSAFGPC